MGLFLTFMRGAAVSNSLKTTAAPLVRLRDQRSTVDILATIRCALVADASLPFREGLRDLAALFELAQELLTLELRSHRLPIDRETLSQCGTALLIASIS